MTDPYSSINLIGAAIAERGYDMRRLRIDDVTYRQFQKGTKIWLTRSAYVQYPFISHTLRLLSPNKDIANEYVRSLGVAIPETAFVSTNDEAALLAAGTVTKPVVVKPANGSGSVGVTRNVQDDAVLHSAVQAVWQKGWDALVQQQFYGEEIRMTVIGEQVGVFWRQSARVLGDAVHTVGELIDEENAKRTTLHHKYITYPQLDVMLITHDVDRSSIPAAGETVLLSDSTLVSGGASAIPIDDEIDASYLDIARKIANGLKTPFLAVDLLVKDFRAPAAADNYIFLECNTAPSIKLYYSFRTGEQFDILGKLADMTDAAL